jgi:CRP-like cAMP-binding protein
MHIEQFDLLKRMQRDFNMAFMDLPIKEGHEEGDFLFRQGDKAAHFYILIKGNVKLSIGDVGHVVHTVDHAGGAFGWSSLLDLEAYSASAECRMATQVLKFDVEKLQKIFETYPGSAHIFFKRLARIIGNRLLQSYKTIANAPRAKNSTSFGTGQVSEATPLNREFTAMLS